VNAAGLVGVDGIEAARDVLRITGNSQKIWGQTLDEVSNDGMAELEKDSTMLLVPGKRRRHPIPKTI
jgi:hypothetical protein